MLLLLAAFGLSPTDTIVGTWVLKSIYATSNVHGPSLSEQNKLIGSKVVIGVRRLRSCGQSVRIRSRVMHKLNPDQFLFGSHVRPNEVGIGSRPITEIVLNNRDAGTCFGSFPVPGQLLYLKTKNELVVDFEGTFYRAVKVN